MENKFRSDDYKKLFFELFYNANENKCNLTIEFINNNLELLKKVVGNNRYGIPKGSTALHLLAMNEINYLLVSMYSSQTFLRNIYNDINAIVNCLYKSIGDKELYTKLKELDIVNKQDVNGKTVMDIINANLENPDEKINDKYLKLKKIIDAINQQDNNAVSIKDDDKPSHYIKIVIDNDSIISETTVRNKKIIKILHNKSKKNYRVFLMKFKKTLKNMTKKISSINNFSLKSPIVRSKLPIKSVKTISINTPMKID
jgi:hypothetical protein